MELRGGGRQVGVRGAILTGSSEYVKSANVALLTPNWICEQAARGGTLMRRQELEERHPEAPVEYYQ